MSRWISAAVVLVLGCLVYAVPAQATAGNTYLVTVGGTDTGDCTVSPCATVQYAIEQHRLAPGPADVIDIGPGSYAQNVDASDGADDDLTIQGAVDGSGTKLTTITGDSGGGPNCMVPCVVQLGGDPDINVKLQDVNVDNTTADDFVTPISIEGGSDLTNVHASAALGAGVSEIVAMCSNPGTVIEDSVIDGSGSFATGIDSTSGAVIRNSVIHSDAGSAILQFLGFGKRPYRIIRSNVSSNVDASQPVLNLTGDLKLDSSLVTGGAVGAFYDGFAATSWRVLNSTIDAGDPGVDNTPDDIDALDVANPNGSPDLDVAVDTSLLVEDIFVYGGSGYHGTGTVTCDYSNLPSTTIPPLWTDNCPLGGASTNTSDPPGDLFVGGPASSYDWQLKDGSPAIDSGRPGPISPGLATRDVAGDPRPAVGLQANCPTPTLDRGAYERAAVLCEPTNRTLPVILDGTAPTLHTKLSATPGGWTGSPTDFAAQWLRCQPANPNDCTTITPYRGWRSYTPRQDDAGFVLRVQVIATNTVGDSAPAVSDPTGVVGVSGSKR